jgi:ribosome-interacting GTPase 1
MASTNQSPFYQRAEQDFLLATTDEERITCLEIMIKECPKHKSSENMRRNLTNRLKRLKEGAEKRRKSGKGNQEGIKKGDMQCILIGLPNTGKSTIFNILTDNKPQSKVSPHQYTTDKPFIGILNYEDVKIQLIDDAPVPNQDKSLINSTDTLLIILTDIEQIKDLENLTWKSKAKKIWIFNKTDNLNEKEKRKLKATLKSKYKKINFKLFSKNSNKNEIEELKKEIFNTFPIIRVYTKEPGKEKTKDPMILKEKSSVKDAAEKIRKNLSKQIKQTKISGPSSKFSGQTVGLKHELKDKDIIELHLK